MLVARWLLVLVTLATTSALAAPAKRPAAATSAQPAQSSPDATPPSQPASSAAAPLPATDKLDAKALMQSGLKLYAARDFLGALAVFKTAYARFASTKILLNIGTTLTKLDRKAEAANAYQRYLDSPDSDRAKHIEVRRVLGELDAAVATLELSITPAEAELQINDEDWIPAASETRHRVAPGPVAVRARHPDYKPEQHSVLATAGESLPVRIALAELPPPPAPAPAPVPSLLTEQSVRAVAVVPAAVEPPRSRFGVLAIAHIDLDNKGGAGPFGGAGLFGATIDVTHRLQAQAAALVGPDLGGYAGASFALIGGKLRPILSAGLPVFFSGGARFSVRGAGGLELDVNRHLALIAELGVEHLFNPEPGVNPARLIFIPAIGAAGRL
jgi:hypothetical protein